jgi:hypothetical protein
MIAERLPASEETSAVVVGTDPAGRSGRQLPRRPGPGPAVTCRVPRERVLLSQFEEWHTALNSSVAILQLPGEPENAFTTRWQIRLPTRATPLDRAEWSDTSRPNHSYPRD